MSRDCICPSIEGYSHIQWIGTYFGACVRTPMEKLSFGIGVLSIVFYLSAFLPQFLHTFKRKSSQGLSLTMIIVWACGDSANLIGTYLTAQLPVQKLIAQSFIFLDFLIITQYFSYFGNDEAEDDVESVASDETMDESSRLIPRRVSPFSTILSKNIISSTVIISCIGFACGIPELFNPIICDAKPFIGSFAVILGTICGWISGLFYFFSRIPQILENYRLKSVEGLSFGLFFLTISGNLSYGLSILLGTLVLDDHFYFQTLPYIIGSLGVLIFDLIIMLQFLIYKPDSQL